MFVFSMIANLQLGMPVDSFGSIFTDLNMEVLGIEMSRYEINTFVGIIAATVVFFGSALVHKREGSFKERIESLEHDLSTPAYAEGAHVDLRGLQSYRLAGRLSILIGAVLLLLAFPTPWFEGAALNGVAAFLAFGIGGATEWATRRFEKLQSQS